MVRKLWALVLIVTIIMAGSVSYADIKVQLEEHWAKDLIEETFVQRHFGPIFENQAVSFKPQESLGMDNFIISLYSLISSYDNISYSNLKNIETARAYLVKTGILETSSNITDESITRKDAVMFMVKTLETICGIQKINIAENPFIDLEELSQEQRDNILMAYQLGLIKGYLDGTFKPNATVSQVEVIILLQRLEGELIMKNKTIPFQVMTTKKDYSPQEESVSVEIKDTEVLVNITRKFPNPGYGFFIKKIEKASQKDYIIYTDTTTPDPNLLYPQVITYRTVTVKINKDQLGNPPYNFQVKGGIMPQPKGIGKTQL